MLAVKKFTFNPFQENTYLIINKNNHVWIVDPGMYHQEEISLMDNYIKDNNYILKGIINTHAHIDHILGVQYIKSTYGIPFHLHDLEKPVLENAKTSAQMFGFNFTQTPIVDHFYNTEQPLKLDEEEIHLILAPGHSPGSVMLYYPKGNWIIGGDVLFNGSIGRTDLPGGNHQQLLDSIMKKVYTLPDQTIVYSGHGDETNIGYEKKHNPFVKA